MVPEVSYKFYLWNIADLSWQYLDKQKALVKGNFIEVSIKRKDIELKKGQNIRLVFDEANAFENNKYNIADFSL